MWVGGGGARGRMHGRGAGPAARRARPPATSPPSFCSSPIAPGRQALAGLVQGHGLGRRLARAEDAAHGSASVTRAAARVPVGGAARLETSAATRGARPRADGVCVGGVCVWCGRGRAHTRGPPPGPPPAVHAWRAIGLQVSCRAWEVGGGNGRDAAARARRVCWPGGRRRGSPRAPANTPLPPALTGDACVHLD